MDMRPATPDQRLSILIIDDEPSILTLRKILLETAGYSVLTASSGKEGLRLFSMHPVDAVVVDYSMPDMDGGTVSSLMKQQKPRMPVIMLSAYSGARDDVHKVVDAFIEKGADPEDLLDRLESLIKLRSHSHAELQSDYVVFVDASQRFLDCSDSVCEFLGYGRAELMDKTIGDITYKGEEFHELWEAPRKNGKSQGDYIVRHKSGRPLLVRYQSWVFADGCMAAVWDPIKDWRELYRLAMLEFDPTKLKNRTELALLEIHRRIREVELAPSKPAGERVALDDALNGLRVLKSER
jgi:PAS domain S-box-containing protein